MARLIVSCALCVAGLADPTPDKRTLLSILEAAYAPNRSLICEYEGTVSLPQTTNTEEFGPGGLFDTFSGVYVHRGHEAILVDIYHKYYAKNQITRETAAMIDGRYVEYSRSVDEPSGGGSITPAHFKRYDRFASLGRLMCDALLLGFLRDDEWKMISQGTEAIDGHNCMVVSFTRSPPGRDDPKLEMNERFWIDIERGGHALKRERYMDGGKLSNRMANIVLEQFEDGQGNSMWLPASGTFESFVNFDRHGNRVFDMKPTNFERYDVLRASIRLNTPISDRRFSVDFRDGALITDNLRHVQYEFGQQLPPDAKRPTRAEAEAMLEEQLRLAEAQGDELKAASWERNGPGWSARAPWIVAFGALAALAVVAIRRRAN